MLIKHSVHRILSQQGNNSNIFLESQHIVHTVKSFIAAFLSLLVRPCNDGYIFTCIRGFIINLQSVRAISCVNAFRLFNKGYNSISNCSFIVIYFLIVADNYYIYQLL